MAHVESNDDVIYMYDLTWPWKVKVTTPIC